MSQKLCLEDLITRFNEFKEHMKEASALKEIDCEIFLFFINLKMMLIKKNTKSE
jgi:hypothetical protein